MRVAGICFLVSSGCAQLLGLDAPALSGGGVDAGDANGSGDGPQVQCTGDNFDDDSIDVSKWFVFEEATTQVAEKDGRLHLLIDDTAGAAYCGVDAVEPLAADETGVQLEIIQPNPSGATELALVLRVTNANQLIFAKDDRFLTATVKTNGANVTQTVNFIADTHKFLRIERSLVDTTIMFSTSRDGMMWTTTWSQDAPFARQNLTPEIYAGHYMQATTAVVEVDNFFVLAPDCVP
jgi:hypothetical protein